MARLHFEINDQLDFRFRDTGYKVKGMKKGNMTRALEEAMELWIAKQGKEKLKLELSQHSDLKFPFSLHLDYEIVN